MKLILVATPKKLEQFLDDALSGFSHTAKRFADSIAQTSQALSQSLNKQYYLFSKDKPTAEAEQAIACEILSKKNQPLELKEKLDIIAEHLALNIPILYVPLDQTEHLEFDIGEAPTNGSFYVSHPFLENVFIRPAEFNKTLAKEKEAAFIRLAAALGAKTIHLNSVTIQQTNQFFGQKAKPHLLAPQIGIKATFNEKGELVKDVYKQYHKPKKQPFVPNELERWVKLDPALRQLATDRMDLNLASVKVSLQFKDTKTTGSEIALALAGRKFEIGGKIEKIQESTWQFHVEFFDKDEIPC